MAGFGGKVLLAGLLLLAASSSAPAWWGYGTSYYARVYYAPAYYYYPVYPVCTTVMPTPPMPPAKNFAEKVPGRTTKEPPTTGDTLKKGPTVIESRSLLGSSVPRVNTSERCKVGFWNLTGRDVTLKVDGQQRLLPSNRAVTLDLERSFSWQIDQREAVAERVPEGQPFHEVILRQ